MRRYHFSLGNSTRGAIGYDCVVRAESPGQAVELLNEALPEEVPVEPYGDGKAIEYINVYLGRPVSLDDIDFEEDV